MRQYLIVVLFSLIALSLSAQTDSVSYEAAPIEIITKHKGNEVMIRWAYTNPNDWLTHRGLSFDLYRRTLGEEGNHELVKENIAVASKKKLEQLFNDFGESVGYAAVYDAYYSEWETSEKGTSYGPFDKKDELESKYLILHYACDIDFEAALAAGLGYRDTALDPSKNYIYRLVPTEPVFTPKHRSAIKDDNSRPLVISEWAENEEQVTIAWSRIKYEGDYSGYFIEKSLDGKSYAQVNELPYVHVLTEDVNDLANILWQENVENYKPAYYRIKGIDAFGELSEPSNAVKLMGRDRTPTTLPFINKTKLNDEQTHVDIEWEYLEDKPADLDYYILQKSFGQSAHSYRDVAKINSEKTSYSDQDVSVAQAVYYKLCAVDTAQNYSCTDPVYTIIDDKIAPAAPKNLRGAVDTSGVVTLNWDLGTEPDLLGYYVQVSNGRERVFVPLTDKPLAADFWYDTIPLDVLTEEIYYRIVAVDLRYNTSDFSEIIQLQKPDIVPPTPSVFKGYKVNDKGVVLNYSLSKSRDVVQYILVKEGPLGKSDIDLKFRSNTYIDEDTSPNKKYKYSIITIDDAGLETNSPQSLIVHTKDNKQGHELALTSEVKGESVVLSWSDPVSEVDYVKIYKGENAQTMTSYKTIKSGSTFKTKSVSLSGEELRARIYYKDGAKSAFSNVVQVL